MPNQPRPHEELFTRFWDAWAEAAAAEGLKGRRGLGTAERAHIMERLRLEHPGLTAQFDELDNATRARLQELRRQT